MTTALAKLAENTGVSTEEITDVVKGMILAGKNQHGAVATNAEMAVVSGICSKYQLNPMMREAHAFISGGKLQVMIGLDGWLKIMNRQPEFDGYEQFDNFNDKGELESVLTKIYIKGRKFPTPHTEYMDEAYQPNSAAWKKFKKRMLSGKSLGQCVRKAFGISEIIDDDEAKRIDSKTLEERDITPQPSVDLKAIDSDMAECGDLATLKSVSGEIKRGMESDGSWSAFKSEVIALNVKHKNRIGVLIEEEKEEAEQSEEEVVEGELLSAGDGDIPKNVEVEFGEDKEG